jgi:hypothetical protein
LLGVAEGEFVAEAVGEEVGLADADSLSVGLAEGDGDGLSGLY